MSRPTLRVEVDDQIFLTQEVGGVSRYFVELMRVLRTNPELEIQTPFYYVVNRHLVDMDPRSFRLVPRRLRSRARAIAWVNHLATPRPPVPDLIHHTYYGPDRLCRNDRAAVPRVCTIYDMIPEIYPDLFAGVEIAQAKRRYVEEVEGILCISGTTRRDLERIYGVQDKPVEVVPLAVSDDFTRGAVIPMIPPPYLLYVGRRGGYKNFRLLLDAFKLLAHMRADLRLVCAGAEPFDHWELAPAIDVADRIHHISPSDKELAGLYMHAAALVFPSKYEGFGLPVLEAFSSGCPVVVGDTPALVEVAGDAACVTPCDDAEQLADILDRLLGDLAARRKFADRGSRRVQDYSWKNTANATASFYSRVRGSSR